eukprot:TRINITY_DN7800_c0_g1_i1.p1 TRINITY_DN7800_c0_g1~~TRINITY_DN7800_c0_g1_i1.p1  ORF type:complete len:202 (-),score=-26.21 TRINITY_DN7800_c0_g1_i1:579-1184(-)
MTCLISQNRSTAQRKIDVNLSFLSFYVLSYLLFKIFLITSKCWIANCYSISNNIIQQQYYRNPEQKISILHSLQKNTTKNQQPTKQVMSKTKKNSTQQQHSSKKISILLFSQKCLFYSQWYYQLTQQNQKHTLAHSQQLKYINRIQNQEQFKSTYQGLQHIYMQRRYNQMLQRNSTYKFLFCKIYNFWLPFPDSWNVHKFC